MYRAVIVGYRRGKKQPRFMGQAEKRAALRAYRKRLATEDAESKEAFKRNLALIDALMERARKT